MTGTRTQVADTANSGRSKDFPAFPEHFELPLFVYPPGVKLSTCGMRLKAMGCG